LPFAVILSSIYDFYAQKFNVKPRKLFTAFSVFTNFPDLVKINKTASLINSIDGIKVLSALWICVGHRKPKYLLNSKSSTFDGIVLKAIGRFDIAVTTFLVCSAVVVTQSLLRSIERCESFADFLPSH
jgi:peptidoglycan/LPS O-acetylase OafA/YrhL